MCKLNLILQSQSISLPCPPHSLSPPSLPWRSMGIWLSSMLRCGKFEHSMFKHGGFSRKGVHSHKQIFTLKNDVYKQRTQHQGKKLNLLKFYRIHWSHKELFKEKIVLELIGNWTQFSPWARRGGLFSKAQMLKGLLRGLMLKLLIAQCIMVLAHIISLG